LLRDETGVGGAEVIDSLPKEFLELVIGCGFFGGSDPLHASPVLFRR
jgi:hypothetical protein